MQRTELNHLLAQLLKVDIGRVTETTRLTDLVVDSFVLIEMVVELQEALDITLVQEDMEDVVYVRQLLDVCETKMAEQGVAAY